MSAFIPLLLHVIAPGTALAVVAGLYVKATPWAAEDWRAERRRSE